MINAIISFIGVMGVGFFLGYKKAKRDEQVIFMSGFEKGYISGHFDGRGLKNDKGWRKTAINDIRRNIQ